jgi:hypothetical protein
VLQQQPYPFAKQRMVVDDQNLHAIAPTHAAEVKRKTR